jgi:predicted alpha-1,2-mannosidase
VKVKVGTSFTSVENARKNLDEEIPHWNFEQTKTELENEWNTLLGKIEVEGGANDDLIKFYTAMYHSFMHPRLFSDVDGSYVGFGADSTIHKAIGYDYYSDFSAWDTYRAQMPLVSLIAPKHYKHMIQSLIAKAEQGGWMPTFPLWNNYTSAMIGDHVSTIIGDAYLKGFDIDIKKAWPYMLKNAFESPAIIDEYVDGKGRRGIESYKEYGYIPLEDQVKDAFHQKEQVSRTLEYAYDDWVLAQVAKKIGKDHDSKNLSIRSENYTNVYDTEKGWVCGRFKDGSFTDDFGKNEKMPYITEGTPKQYTWYVPHNIPGLIDLMGGEKKFKEKLSTFIDKKEYWHGNEPSHHIPYLFNYIGDWKKTQETVKNILKSQYGITNLGGLAGNDDAGQLSAWYVFSAMGFYPVCPGSNEYQLSSPIFEKVTINLDQKYFPGKKFVFNGDSLKNYGTFNKVKLNGKITNPVLLHNDLIKGGQLDYITEQ